MGVGREVAYLTATREMTSLQKQNPQTSQVQKVVHAAVVAKTLRLDIFHFSSQSRFPLVRLGMNGAWGR